MRISDWSSDVCSSDLENAALDDRYTRTTELIRMLALTGCRRSEVIEIRWSEIDSAGSAFRLDDTKEGQSVRPIGLPVLEYFDERRSDGAEDISPCAFPGRNRSEERSVGKECVRTGRSRWARCL